MKLKPNSGETVNDFVDRCLITLKYVPADPTMFRPHYAEVWSPDQRKVKEAWLNEQVGRTYWCVAGLWWYFDNAEDAAWFKLSF